MGTVDIFASVLATVSKPIPQRGRAEIENLLPWLRKNSQVLRSIEKDVLFKLIKGSEYERVTRDDVIIRQGDVGDSFYVILNGKTSIYIDALKSGEEAPPGDLVVSEGTDTARSDGIETPRDSRGRHGREGIQTERLDRSQFGKFIMIYETGKSFGEIALMTSDAARNASIIADEDTDLLVIHRELFNGTLKEKQEEEYAERQAFVESCPLFKHWSPRFRRLLEMSIRKETHMFDGILVRQGDPVEGLHFIVKGQGKLLVNPGQHRKQYPRLTVSSNDELARELARAIPDEKGDQEKTCAQSEQIRVRRHQGYASAEKRLAHKSLTLCFVDESEIVGAAEVLLGLETYAHTVTCTGNTEVYILDNKNIERLITKKNPQTLDILRARVVEKITARLASQLGAQIELYPVLKDRLAVMNRRIHAGDYGGEDEQSAPKASLKPDMDRETSFTHMVKLFLDDKAPLIEPSVPGTVYYVAKSREKAKRKLTASLQNRTQHAKAPTQELRLQRARKMASQRRQPRSRRELEKLTVGPTDAEHMKTLQDENQAVSRFLTQRRIRPSTSAPRLGHHSTSTMSSSSSSGSSSSANIVTELDLDLDKRVFQEVEGDSEGHIALTPKDINHEVVRRVVLEMGDLQGTANTNRARVISAMIERKSQKTPGAIQSLLRPASAPLPRKDGAKKHKRTTFDLHLQSDSESEDDFDAETSESALKSLEEKIRDFHLRHERESGSRCGAQVPELRRFNLQGPQGVPVPGGTVLIRQRECQQPSNSSGEGVGHSHVRRFIVPKDAYTLAVKATSAFENQALSTLSSSERDSRRVSVVSNASQRKPTHKKRVQSAPLPKHKLPLRKVVTCS